MKRLILSLCAVLTLTALNVFVSDAAPAEPLEGCYFWDFTDIITGAAQRDEWEVWDRATNRVDLGTAASNGWQTENYGSNAREVNIRYVFDDPQVISSVRYTIVKSTGGGIRISYSSYSILLSGDGPIDTFPGDVVQFGSIKTILPPGDTDIISSSFSNVTAQSVAISVAFAQGNPITITNVEICGPVPPEEELIRPLKQTDEHEWGVFEVAQDFSPGVLAMSETPGADVHVATDGVVLVIEPLTLYPCRSWIGPVALEDFIDSIPLLPEIIDILPGYVPKPNLDTSIPCAFEVPESVHGVAGSAGYVYTIGSALWVNPFDGAIPIPGVWRVQILEGDLLLGNSRIFEYFLADADLYIESGDVVTAGCVIGKTAPMRGFALSLDLSESLFRPQANQGVAFVGLLGEPQEEPTETPFGDLFYREREELLPLLIEYPTEDACNNDPETATCLGDARLLRSSNWSQRGNIDWLPNGGVVLHPDAAISSDFNLDDELNIYVDTMAATVAGTGRLHVTISDVGSDFNVTETLINYRLTETTPVPDVGIFFRLRLENRGATLIQIIRVCVQNGGGGGGGGEPSEPSEPPPFKENCQIVEQPATETLVAQIGWHWSRLDQFFECDLMKMLNRMFTMMSDTYRLIGWITRWWMSVVMMGNDWAGRTFFPYLSGHFANMANGRVTFIEVEGGGSCNNLFCVIESLFGSVDNIFNQLGSIIKGAISEVIAPVVALLSNIIGMTAEFLFNLLTAIVSTGLRVINTIFIIFQDGSGLLYGLVVSWNTTPATTIPGLPQCQVNPQENGFCMFMWLLENTIFSGTGSIILTIAFAYGSISLVLYVIKESRQILTEIGQQL